MKYNRTYNFSAGPAMMPEPVLEEIRDEMMNYRGSGMCVMEMSHRSKVFQQIVDEAEADLRDLMGIPDNYKVLFIQGGATLQFAAVPWNLMKNGKACYVETGAWSKKAIAEAKKYGEVIVAASSKDKNYSYIPDCSDLDIPEDADYVYICENETIHGVTWQQLPNTKGHILVSDQSSMFLSQPCNVSDYGMIYAGVQKNVGPAGMVIAIIREDLIREISIPRCPSTCAMTPTPRTTPCTTPRTAGRFTAAARCSSTSRASAVSRRCTNATSRRPRSSMTSWIPPRCSMARLSPSSVPS